MFEELQVARYTGSVSWRLSIQLGWMDKLGQDTLFNNFLKYDVLYTLSVHSPLLPF